MVSESWSRQWRRFSLLLELVWISCSLSKWRFSCSLKWPYRSSSLCWLLRLKWLPCYVHAIYLLYIWYPILESHLAAIQYISFRFGCPNKKNIMILIWSSGLPMTPTTLLKVLDIFLAKKEFIVLAPRYPKRRVWEFSFKERVIYFGQVVFIWQPYQRIPLLWKWGCTMPNISESCCVGSKPKIRTFFDTSFKDFPQYSLKKFLTFIQKYLKFDIPRALEIAPNYKINVNFLCREKFPESWNLVSRNQDNQILVFGEYLLVWHEDPIKSHCWDMFLLYKHCWGVFWRPLYPIENLKINNIQI